MRSIILITLFTLLGSSLALPAEHVVPRSKPAKVDIDASKYDHIFADVRALKPLPPVEENKVEKPHQVEVAIKKEQKPQHVELEIKQEQKPHLVEIEIKKEQQPQHVEVQIKQ